MRGFIREYGLFAISLIGIACFLGIFSTMLSGDNSIVVTYLKNTVDMGTDGGKGSPSKDSFGITGIVTKEVNGVFTSQPYFEVADNKSYTFEPVNMGTENFDYSTLSDVSSAADTALKNAQGSEHTIIKRDFLLNGIEVFYTDKDGNKVKIPNDEITINLTIYEPQMEYASNTSSDTSLHSVSITGKILYEDVRAVDKYGNYILDDNGDYVLTSRVAYKRNSRDRGLPSTELAANDYRDYGTYIIDFGGISKSEGYSAEEVASSDEQGIEEYNLSSDLPYKIKAVYRVKHDTISTEYTAIYTNTLRYQSQRAMDIYNAYFTNGDRNALALNEEEKNPVSVMMMRNPALKYEWEYVPPELPDEELELDDEPVVEEFDSILDGGTDSDDNSNPDNSLNPDSSSSSNSDTDSSQADFTGSDTSQTDSTGSNTSDTVEGGSENTDSTGGSSQTDTSGGSSQTDSSGDNSQTDSTGSDTSTELEGSSENIDSSGGSSQTDSDTSEETHSESASDESTDS